MVTRCVGVVVVTSLLSALSTVPARGQAAPTCPRGGSLWLTPAVVGSLIMREGGGLGGVNIGSTAADVERAWGLPSDCTRQEHRYSYIYNLTGDGGQTGLAIVVLVHNGAVEQIFAALLPHSGGAGPPLHTGRGLPLGAPLDDVRRIYGNPSSPDARLWIYTSEGVGFYRSRAWVSGILVFKPGAVPVDWIR
jgi:hypothetical protein